METSHTLQGIPVVPGVGWGPAIRPASRPEPPVMAARAQDPEVEISQLHQATQKAIDNLTQRAAQTNGAAAEVLSTTAAMAADPELAKTAEAFIREGSSAVQAIWSATNAFIETFRSAGGLLAERITDLADIRDRVTAQLLGLAEPGVPLPTEPSVLLAEDLAPADTAGLDPALIMGIAIRLGGPTSHTAIIARQLGIPCVVGVTDLDTIAEGVPVLIDGSEGAVVANPDPDFASEQQRRAEVRAEEAARWVGEGRTRDGHLVELLANVQDADGARAAADGVAVGVGLFRTEIAFLQSPTEPMIDRQVTVYRGVFEAFDSKKVVVRTLDAGSDKPMPFITYENEANPALGVRGVRVAFNDEGLLDRQLDAIAQANAQTGSPAWVMAPMVATRAEARFFAEKVRQRGLVPGVMIEVPSAALRARDILAEVDFVSIGTNDLAQYTMAADRLSPQLASLCDPWQPAVLALIEATALAGHEVDKPVGVCGEAAADPLLAPVLVGLGVTSLSATYSALPSVGASLARVDLNTCRTAAQEALLVSDAAEARAVARAILEG